MTTRVRIHTRAYVLRAIALAATLAIGPAADARGRRKPDLVERQLGNPPAQLASGRSFTTSDAVLSRGAASRRAMRSHRLQLVLDRQTERRAHK